MVAKAGKRKEMVLPLPVAATPITSFCCIASGQQYCWICDGAGNPASFSASWIFAGNGASSKVEYRSKLPTTRPEGSCTLTSESEMVFPLLNLFAPWFANSRREGMLIGICMAAGVGTGAAAGTDMPRPCMAAPFCIPPKPGMAPPRTPGRPIVPIPKPGAAGGAPPMPKGRPAAAMPKPGIFACCESISSRRACWSLMPGVAMAIDDSPQPRQEKLCTARELPIHLRVF
mmetsp:Transcript_22581/g.52596  ORF Transcript_22581/g.52596 Transcript_22581/m.52596 type:complete len:230 (-) Transcript_22581:98-787(-)